MATGVFIYDPFTIERKGIIEFLNNESNFEVVGQSGKVNKTKELLVELTPEVAILDLSLPSLAGLTVAYRIKNENISTKVLFFSNLNQGKYIRQALEAGSLGYVLKSDTSEDLLKGLYNVSKGNHYLSSSCELHREEADHQLKSSKLPEKILTSRQKEILRLITQGLTNKKIAKQLSVSVKTVETHRANIGGKLGTNNPAELTLYAIRHHLISRNNF